MDLNPGQLDALVAIAEHGSFDAAARQLHITPSAVSQRVRALEAAAGQVLISRGTPCRPTPQGERLVRLGRQTRLLYAEASQALGAAAAVELPVAVNADSLATWFRDVLGEVASWDATAVKLSVDDQAYSQELLRSGDRARRRDQRPGRRPGLHRAPARRAPLRPRRHPRAGRPLAAGRSPDWAAMPLVVFNDKDDLQAELLRRHGVDGRPAGRAPGAVERRLLPPPSGSASAGGCCPSRRPATRWPPASWSGCRPT